jgi:hypothetical protein
VKAFALRTSTSDQGTFSVLRSEDSTFSCFLSELPERNNIPTFSCIPPSVYNVIWDKSPKFGWCYHVLDVHGRGNILIHSGNWVGDSTKGYKTNSYGCILPAKKLGILAGQKAGLLSLPTLRRLESFFERRSFILEIRNAYDPIITP